MERVRVVVSGIGVVSSVGTGRAAFWEALEKGACGTSRIESFDTSNFPTHFGGEVKDFSPQRFIPRQRLSRMGRASQLSLAAAHLAADDAGVSRAALDAANCGVCLGTTMGESQVLERLNEIWVSRGQEHMESGMMLQYPCNMLAANVAIGFKLKGPHFVIPTACAAGNYAIGYAFDKIRSGEAEMMFAGGADAFSKIAFVGFNRLYAVAPEKVQPFDRNRKGMMVGEGAGVLLLESWESCRKRKRIPYAEVAGYGLSCDAHHMTAPQSDGIAAAIEKAIAESGVSKDEVGYFNAHGTGTPANDTEECLALQKVFGERLASLPVSSIKSMLGHTMGAASAIEAIACCFALTEGLIPPTINFETPDPECPIDCVPNHARKARVEVAVNSSSAFGGNNACLVLKAAR
jgi:3-oxoacyl-[acyl-carrier-protein] synthase II